MDSNFSRSHFRTTFSKANQS